VWVQLLFWCALSPLRQRSSTWPHLSAEASRNVCAGAIPLLCWRTTHDNLLGYGHGSHAVRKQAPTAECLTTRSMLHVAETDHVRCPRAAFRNILIVTVRNCYAPTLLITR
jgi:hypothetical protein